MKKHILCLIIILSLLSSFIQPAFAVGNDYSISGFSASQDIVYGKYLVSTELTVTKNTDTDSGSLLLAYYDENGKAIKIQLNKLSTLLSLASGESKSYRSEVVSFDNQVNTIKAMIWNESDGMLPMAEAAVLSNLQITTENYYAIVEGYNALSESAYLDVITLSGDAKRLYIDSSFEAMADATEVIESIKGSAIDASGVESFVGTPLDTRIIEYTVNSSNERIYDITLIAATAFTNQAFNLSEMTLSRPLSDDVVILDAIDYMNKGTSATVSDYTVTDTASLFDGIKYSGFLLQPNSDGKYENLVITWIDFQAVNYDMVTNLTRCSADIQANLGPFKGNARMLILTVQNCINSAIVDANTNVIDADFIRKKYASEITTAKGYYDAIKADETQLGRFNEALGFLDSATLTWLGTEFGVI